jgi:Helix-turn-helix domain
MRTAEEVDCVLELARTGQNLSAIARLTGISRSTIREWIAGRVPARRAAAIDGLPRAAYAYLLGLYLGDGFIAHGPRASCLRIFFEPDIPASRRSGACHARRPAVQPRVGRASRADAMRRSASVVDTLA